MSLAIENFASLSHPNKMVILGDMLELGSESEKEHDAIVNLLQQKNISNAILVGPLFMASVKNTNTKAFSTSEEAVEFLKQNKIADSTILIKGSRGIKLEKIVEVL